MSLFISSFMLGIAFCAPPGIVTAETVRRGLARGFWPALRVQIGSVLGDTTWAALAMAGAAFLIQNWVARILLSLLGMGLLLRLAWLALKDARDGGALSVTVGAPGERGDLATGALLSLGNPFAIAFWVGVSGSIFAGISDGPQWFHFVIFFAALLSSTILWCFFMAGLIAWGKRFVTPAFFRGINLVCGLTLGFFGLKFAWDLVQAVR